ncbi:hypothetical protein GCM10023081_43470 [Arthrobacter ginkgonis]|uniref:DUF3311 domain-containing protein n=1 Tax=Arthrobacter ginkgonis TaxID=1630594 RepID=A0ABP7DCD4_9MICC
MSTPTPAGRVRLATPGRLALAALPIIGFFATPWLPFAREATLWFGFPAVMVWFGLMVLLTVAVLQVIDGMYLRAGGREQDACDEEGISA